MSLVHQGKNHGDTNNGNHLGWTILGTTTVSPSDIYVELYILVGWLVYGKPIPEGFFKAINVYIYIYIYI